jgi:hypothetical protein
MDSLSFGLSLSLEILHQGMNALRTAAAKDRNLLCCSAATLGRAVIGSWLKEERRIRTWLSAQTHFSCSPKKQRGEDCMHSLQIRNETMIPFDIKTRSVKILYMFFRKS